ncbi:MAG: hypothetical protein AAFR22_25840, partial [Chloroflexota bacterium]
LYDQIVDNRGKMRDWMDKIPGLRGYMDKGDRRTADRMLRDYIAGELEKRLARFSGIEKQILKSGGLSMMSSTREAKEKFQTYISKVKAAAPGYSGLFAKINVDEEAMDRIYAFDEAQVRYMAQFDEALDTLENAAGSGEGLEGAIQGFYNLAQEAMQAFALREDVLTNINKELGQG